MSRFQSAPSYRWKLSEVDLTAEFYCISPAHALTKVDCNPQWPDSFTVCTFTFQVCFGSRFSARRRSHCEVAVFCVLRPEWGKQGVGQARQETLPLCFHFHRVQAAAATWALAPEPRVTFTEYFLRCFGLIIVHSMGNRRGPIKTLQWWHLTS